VVSRNTADEPPQWIVPILQEYQEVLVEECGFLHGAWVTVKFPHGGHEQTVTLRRNGLNEIEVKEAWRGRIDFDSPVRSEDYDTIAERDEMIGDELSSALSGHESFAVALTTNVRGSLTYT
jgi:hypothetical protein